MSLASSVAPNCKVKYPTHHRQLGNLLLFQVGKLYAVLPPILTVRCPPPPPPSSPKVIGRRIWSLTVLSKMKLQQLWRQQVKAVLILSVTHSIISLKMTSKLSTVSFRSNSCLSDMYQISARD